ncbi:MAG: hypothetical protein N3A57_03135 [Negativicutes bacterium]|nr:hypothetical protein [Negativicutes bacterium]
MRKMALVMALVMVAVAVAATGTAGALFRPVQTVMVRIDVQAEMAGGWQPLPNVGTYHLIDRDSGQEMASSPAGADGSGVLMLQFTTNTGQQWNLDVTYSDFRGRQKAINQPGLYVDDFNCGFPFRAKVQLSRERVQIRLATADGTAVANGVVVTNDGDVINFNKDGLAWVPVADDLKQADAAGWVRQKYAAANLSGVSRPPSYRQEDSQGFAITFVQ